MCSIFSQLWELLKKYLSLSSIKATYRKVSDMVKRVAKKEETKAYYGFSCRVLKRLWQAFSQAFVFFGAAVTVLYLGWGLSVLIEGWSGTMTMTFEAQWLKLVAEIAGVVFIALFVLGIYASVCDFIVMRRKLKLSNTDKDSKEFVTVVAFEQFKKETRDEFANINKSLGNIERILNKLIKSGNRTGRRR